MLVRRLGAAQRRRDRRSTSRSTTLGAGLARLHRRADGPGARDARPLPRDRPASPAGADARLLRRDGRLLPLRRPLQHVRLLRADERLGVRADRASASRGARRWRGRSTSRSPTPSARSSCCSGSRSSTRGRARSTSAQIGDGARARTRSTGSSSSPCALIVAGFLIKAAAVPFHFWLADAYAVAPTPICLLLAGAMSELGIFGIARVWFGSFGGRVRPSTPTPSALVLIVAGAATALLGGGDVPRAGPPQADARLRHDRLRRASS